VRRHVMLKPAVQEGICGAPVPIVSTALSNSEFRYSDT
jgi:hypothetical protein